MLPAGALSHCQPAEEPAGPGSPAGRPGRPEGGGPPAAGGQDRRPQGGVRLAAAAEGGAGWGALCFASACCACCACYDDLACCCACLGDTWLFWQPRCATVYMQRLPL